jgi:hypothetical protein
LLDSVLGNVSPSDGCAACYNSTAPKRCLSCLYDNKPCAKCAMQDAPTVDVS